MSDTPSRKKHLADADCFRAVACSICGDEGEIGVMCDGVLCKFAGKDLWRRDARTVCPQCLFRASRANPPTAVNIGPGIWEDAGHWFCRRCEARARLNGDLPPMV
jgi:hypothetical protein